MIPSSKASSSLFCFLFQKVVTRRPPPAVLRRSASTTTPFSSSKAFSSQPPQAAAAAAGDCFFTYWSFLGACVGWGMTASSALAQSKHPPSSTMTQDVILYSTCWALGSLVMTRNVPLMMCHASNAMAVLYHYDADVHQYYQQIKTYQATDWQCHGEQQS